MLALKARSKSRVDTRSKNIQMIRHIQSKKPELE